MVFYCWSSLRVRNPRQSINIFNCWTNCIDIKGSVHLNPYTYFINALIGEVIGFIKPHFLSVILPSSICIFCSFSISFSTSSPLTFWAIRVSYRHFHPKCLKNCSYLYLCFISSRVEESL